MTKKATKREPGSLEVVPLGGGGSIFICGHSTWVAEESRRLPGLRAKFSREAKRRLALTPQDSSK